MDAANLKGHIERDGFCVLDQVIPADSLAAVCDELWAAVKRNRQDSEAEKAKTQGRGHRIGTPGVVSMKQVINEVQSFAPYLADRRRSGGQAGWQVAGDRLDYFPGTWCRSSSWRVLPSARCRPHHVHSTYRTSCVIDQAGVTNFTGNGRMNYERLYGIAV